MKIIYLLILMFCCYWSASWAQTTNTGYPKSWTEKKLFQQIDWRDLPKVDLKTIEQEDALNDTQRLGPWRFGFKHFVQYDLQNSGTWNTLDNGDRIWRLGIYSKDALTMNLLFDHFYLPEGATLYLYNPRTKELRGAYTAANNNVERKLGSTLLKGENLVVEYYEPQSALGQGAIKIGAVVHGYRSISQFPQERLVEGLNSSGNCNHDVACPLGNGWQHPINSVAMVIVNGNGVCTGALINNTSNNGIPYFLSANHCGTVGLSTWVFRFNWESPVASCAQTTSSQAPSGPFNEVNGAILRASNPRSDFALMQLDTVPQGAIYYAGWDRSRIAATQTTGIHHPRGDVKKICRDNDPPVVATFGIASVWKVIDWDQGVTEPSSSGSPLFNQNQLIVGQLYGGSATCLGVDDNGQPDHYGRLDISWNGSAANTRLRDWLDPSNSNAMIHFGYDPNAPSYALDAGLLQLQNIKNSYCNVDSILPKVVLRNFGTTTITSVDIKYNLNGSPNTTYNWTGNLPSQTITTVNLPAMAVSAGNHTFMASTDLPNNGVDSNSTNNSLTKQFNVTSNGNSINYFLAMDCYGSEITWTLSDSITGAILFSGGPYNDNFNTVDTFINEFCLPIGCYKFTIMDKEGDGLDGSSGVCRRIGDYWISDANGNELVRMNAPNGDFDSIAVHSFCINGLNTSLINTVNSFNVYPNPTQDQLSVQVELAQTSDITLVVYNAMGQELQQIQRKDMNKEQIELDVSSYGAGLYMIVLKTGKQVTTKKIIKH